MWEALFFYSIGGVAIASALLMVLMKNPVVSAVYLVVTFFSLAGLFVLLEAQLLAALQVIVYAGAIMVLFLFVIMLLNLNRTEFTSYKLFFTKVLALLLVALALWVVSGALGEAGQAAVPTLEESAYSIDAASPHSMGFARMLFTRYVYPFEIIGIMLLAGIIGAVLMAKKKV